MKGGTRTQCLLDLREPVMLEKFDQRYLFTSHPAITQRAVEDKPPGMYVSMSGARLSGARLSGACLFHVWCTSVWCMSGARLVHVCTTSVPRLVHVWCTSGARLVHVWCTSGTCLVHVWCTSGACLVPPGVLCCDLQVARNRPSRSGLLASPSPTCATFGTGC